MTEENAMPETNYLIGRIVTAEKQMADLKANGTAALAKEFVNWQIRALAAEKRIAVLEAEKALLQLAVRSQLSKGR